MFVRNYLSFSIYSATAEHEDEAERNPNGHCEEAFVFWGIWHFLYFYIEGSIQFVQVSSFLLGLLINCFILSALYYKTKSLWICVMTHALINTLSQISVGGNLIVSMICKVIIICIAIFISRGVCTNNEKKN